jgi:hypothetical protein
MTLVLPTAAAALAAAAAAAASVTLPDSQQAGRSTAASQICSHATLLCCKISNHTGSHINKLL